jgi:hypothetical protein
METDFKNMAVWHAGVGYISKILNKFLFEEMKRIDLGNREI